MLWFKIKTEKVEKELQCLRMWLGNLHTFFLLYMAKFFLYSHNTLTLKKGICPPTNQFSRSLWTPNG